ncbi:PKD domain-containing protein [Flagellimonas hymeniacidonis]|uniref:PKD domain-containing protein n=1 Tax=Flagellimonas hymeniacidonis TaxID=2603628 RepID=A0A5C8V0S8_9FLAO|nr:PKD domain-containing protein [Flagellimonas hymeniacidonis]TXN35230.1 PKD domain-containing protein [Flagellimonas hymeniacidonis]
MKYKVKIFSNTKWLLLSLVVASFVVSCVGDELFRDELPDANSKADTVFPEANFAYASSSDDFRMINFSNLSSEATSFEWDFGGGNTSTDLDPTFTFEGGEGTYPVTLTASDANGITGAITIDVMVVEGPFQPIILEAGFEDDTLPEGGGDGRDSWRNNDLGGVIQITGDPVTFGDQGAKLPVPAGDRIGYQEITVEPDTNYDLRFWYTMLSGSSDPSLTVAVLGVTEFGPFGTKEEALDGVIASVTVTDDSEPDVYVQQKLSFNSGINNTVAIFFTNGEVECRLDDFTIDVGAAGAVPPSAGFSSAQSEINFLEYTFTNSSTGATSYEWDFGDENTSTEESPTHIYTEADTYTVTLIATNDSGLSTTLEQTIDIQAPVTADFTFEVDAMDYKTYIFTDASEDAVSLLWEFGDGFQFTGMNPSHTYAEDGTYTVTLTASSITGATSIATAQFTVAAGFVVQVLNGTFDDHGVIGSGSTGDNADAWDMTPNPTILDESGAEIPSPYTWRNEDLNDYIDGAYCTNEQIGSTSDGNNGTRGGKISNSCRRLYQPVQVEQGVEYTFSIDTRSEAMGVNTEVFILNTEITTETGIDASTSDPAIDAYFDITNDFNADKTVFTTSTFTFTPSTNQIVIYVRALLAVDGSTEVFLDNVEITEN